MKIIRLVLISMFLFNGLAADAAGQAMQESPVVPAPVFSIVLGYSLPLEMVTHLIEKYYPVAEGSSGGKEEKKTRQHVSDLLSPGVDSGNGIRARAYNVVVQSMFVARSIEPLRYSALFQYLERLRTSVVCHLALTYLIILALKNLPEAKLMNYVLIIGERGSSRNGWAFSVGIAPC